MSASKVRSGDSRMDRTATTNASRNSSAMPWCRYSRSIEMQSCPADEKHARTAPSTALPMLASSATYIAFLPPSSREAPTSRRPAFSATDRPVAVDPVKQT
jgi:hypothetical protein